MSPPAIGATSSRSSKLFDQDMLGDDLEAWPAESSLIKRTLPQLRDHRRPDRAALSGRGEELAARRRSRPISSTTCCASTSPTICCCAPPMRTRRPASSTSAALREMLRASRPITHNPLDRVSPLAVPALLEMRQRMVVLGEASEALLARGRGGPRPGGDGINGTCQAVAGNVFIARHNAVRPRNRGPNGNDNPPWSRGTGGSG